jgi:hypothetical protein
VPATVPDWGTARNRPPHGARRLHDPPAPRVALDRQSRYDRRPQTERALTYVFISHDLNVIEYVSDRVLVMYLGEVVETGTAEALAQSPKHPYTQALFASAPSMDPDQRMDRLPIAGDPPPDRLPVPHPLPVRDAPLRGANAAAGGRERRARGGVLSVRGGGGITHVTPAFVPRRA